MKKDKNTELNKKNAPKGVADGSKTKTKPTKKPNNSEHILKRVAAKVAAKKVDLKHVKVVTPKITTPENGTKGKNKKVKKPVEKKKNKTSAESKTVAGAEVKQLDEKVLAKIEKKKAKKLAQKLKKKQKKSSGPKESSTTKEKKDSDSVEKAGPKNKKAKTAKTEPEADDDKEDDKKKLKTAKKQKQKQERKDAKEHIPRDAASDAATVFVGNLPINTKRVQLMRLFEPYAPVQAIRFRTAGGRAIFKHKHRKEAGALNAYVMLKSVVIAGKALSLNGTEFKGNHLRVTKADFNSHNRVDADAKHMIFVGNLKYSATDEKLREIFSSCGEIEYIRCLRDGEKGCKGVAYVCFKTPEAVGLAMELNETVLDERPIHVERYSVKKLGAKEARDKAAIAEKKPKAIGAKKRLDEKKKKSGGKKPVAAPGPAGGAADKKKNSEFRGVKVGDLKKKQKKKKVTSQMAQLAKKIAPKAN